MTPRNIPRARQLRRDQTHTEAILWRALRNRRLDDHKFRRQYPIDRYIADFCCPEQHLILEIDGDTHAHDPARDGARNARLNALGYRVLHVANRDIVTNLEGALQLIRDELDRREN